MEQRIGLFTPTVARFRCPDTTHEFGNVTVQTPAGPMLFFRVPDEDWLQWWTRLTAFRHNATLGVSIHERLVDLKPFVERGEEPHRLVLDIESKGPVRPERFYRKLCDLVKRLHRLFAAVYRLPSAAQCFLVYAAHQWTDEIDRPQEISLPQKCTCHLVCPHINFRIRDLPVLRTMLGTIAKEWDTDRATLDLAPLRAGATLRAPLAPKAAIDGRPLELWRLLFMEDARAEVRVVPVDELTCHHGWTLLELYVIGSMNPNLVHAAHPELLADLDRVCGVPLRLPYSNVRPELTERNLAVWQSLKRGRWSVDSTLTGVPRPSPQQIADAAMYQGGKDHPLRLTFDSGNLTEMWPLWLRNTVAENAFSEEPLTYTTLYTRAMEYINEFLLVAAESPKNVYVKTMDNQFGVCLQPKNLQAYERYLSSLTLTLPVDATDWDALITDPTVTKGVKGSHVRAAATFDAAIRDSAESASSAPEEALPVAAVDDDVQVIKVKPQQVFTLWHQWSRRNDFVRVVCKPSASEYSVLDATEFNTFHGFRVSPSVAKAEFRRAYDNPEAVELFRAWMRFIFNVWAGGEDEVFRQLMYFFAWVLQRRTRAELMPLILGAQGCGKSSVLELFRIIMGPPYFVAVTRNQVEGQWNSWAEYAVLVCFEEATFTPQLMDALKCPLTTTWQRVDAKYVEPRTVQNNATWIALSDKTAGVFQASRKGAADAGDVRQRRLWMTKCAEFPDEVTRVNELAAATCRESPLVYLLAQFFYTLEIPDGWRAQSAFAPLITHTQILELRKFHSPVRQWLSASLDAGKLISNGMLGFRAEEAKHFLTDAMRRGFETWVSPVSAPTLYNFFATWFRAQRTGTCMGEPAFAIQWNELMPPASHITNVTMMPKALMGVMAGDGSGAMTTQEVPMIYMPSIAELRARLARQENRSHGLAAGVGNTRLSDEMSDEERAAAQSAWLARSSGGWQTRFPSMATRPEAQCGQ